MDRVEAAGSTPDESAELESDMIPAHPAPCYA